MRFVNVGNIATEEVFENLRCSREGLSSQPMQERLTMLGYNKLEVKMVRIATNR